MFESAVFPVLRDMSGDVFVKRRLLRVSGMGESAIDEAIAPIYKSYPHVETSILFNRSEVEVHIAAKSDSAEISQATVDELAQKIVEKLGVAVFATNGELMEEVVGELLKRAGKTLSVAESCTGGLIAARLTDVPGSSAYFIEGVTAYANEAKMRTLNVREAILVKHGAVSAETAEAMAVGMRERAQTDYAISITGIAGPGGGSEEKPVGTVFIGLADSEKVRSIQLVLPGDRYLIRWRSSQAALDYLRRRLLKAA